jgi:hypothetical protein
VPRIAKLLTVLPAKFWPVWCEGLVPRAGYAASVTLPPAAARGATVRLLGKRGDATVQLRMVEFLPDHRVADSRAPGRHSDCPRVGACTLNPDPAKSTTMWVKSGTTRLGSPSCSTGWVVV